MSTPFKMKGFSGFGNSPLEQNKKKKKTLSEMSDEEVQAAYDRNESKEQIAHMKGNVTKAFKPESADGTTWQETYQKFQDDKSTAQDSLNILSSEQFRRKSN